MTLVLSATIAFLATLALTPVLRRWLIDRGVVDSPDGRRKLQSRLVPVGGGVAVFFGLTVGVAIAAAFAGFSATEWTSIAIVAAAGGFIALVGFADDRWGMRGRQKLLFQVAAVGLLIASGVIVERIEFLGIEYELSAVSLLVTAGWLLLAMNAINLLDGVDGLATGISIVIAATLCAMAVHNGHLVEAIIAAGLAGGLLAFLFYNKPPASIYLGDTGSLSVGLILGVLAVTSSLKGATVYAISAPIAIWAIPAMDTLMAIVRRKLSGQSLYTTDRGHLHHHLEARGMAKQNIVLTAVVLCSITSGLAYLSVVLEAEWIAVAGAATVVFGLILTRTFGHSECRLALKRAGSFVSSLFSPFGRQGKGDRSWSSRLQGEREWGILWSELITFAKRFDIQRLRLIVHAPARQENFVAQWDSGNTENRDSKWELDVPIVTTEGQVGRFKVTGQDAPSIEWIGDVLAGLVPFENQLVDILLHGQVSKIPKPDEAREAVPRGA